MADDVRNQVKEWAKQQLVKEGHSQSSVILLVDVMPYEEQVKYAEKFNPTTGSIVLGVKY